MTAVTSLYSGAGGLDIGFAQAGCEITWANDTDEHARAIHASQFPHCHFSPSPAEDHVARDGASLPDSDLIIGGPSCQAFSVAGKQDGLWDERGHHVLDFAELVKAKRPRAFVMENVANLLTSKHHASIMRMIRDMLSPLYHIATLLVDAADFGVPQHRKRMIMAGFPAPVLNDFTSALYSRRASRLSTVREAIAGVGGYGSRARITLARNPVLRPSPYAGMLFNGARPLNLDAPSYTLPAIMGGNKTPVIDVAALEDGGDLGWIESYHQYLITGQLKPEDIKGVTVPRSLQRITVQEAATLQTFPVSIPWDTVPMSAAYRLIGNAVPCLLAQAIAASVLEVLG